MPGTQSAQEILDRQFLEIRCGLLNLAASLDRLSRAPGGEHIAEDDRMQKLFAAMEIVASAEGQRAERLQLLFSDAYEEGWNR